MQEAQKQYVRGIVPGFSQDLLQGTQVNCENGPVMTLLATGYFDDSSGLRSLLWKSTYQTSARHHLAWTGLEHSDDDDDDDDDHDDDDDDDDDSDDDTVVMMMMTMMILIINSVMRTTSACIANNHVNKCDDELCIHMRRL